MSWYRWNDPNFPPPRDGTKIDILYPYPRGRAADCFWSPLLAGWGWLEPRWKKGELLPESEWHHGCYPMAQPTHWRLAPQPPSDYGPACEHPWSTVDEIGRPFCDACGQPRSAPTETAGQS